jgi:carboxymethylenebutenolidase
MISFLRVVMVASALVACQPSDTPPDGASGVEATAAAHEHDAPVATPLADAAPVRPVLEQTLAYGEYGNRNLEGFLSMPADVAEPQPGLLVIHEWWGLNDNVRAVTRRLAAEGYIALAVDLYGGATATTPAEAQTLMTAALAEPEAIHANLEQAYEYLERYAFSPTIGSIGWCFGGGWSLQAALRLPDRLDAAVMYYGPVVTDPETLQALEAPLLGLFGGLDTTIPVRDVQVFRNLLRELGKDAEVFIYSDANHAFANPSGGNYAPEAAEDAWRRTLDFLATRLRAAQ